jgi:hypothetical protein
VLVFQVAVIYLQNSVSLAGMEEILAFGETLVSFVDITVMDNIMIPRRALVASNQQQNPGVAAGKHTDFPSGIFSKSTPHPHLQ